ncbi:glycosyltransferase family 4 protein [Aestuariibacter salexigens]|uniref:glycosyltransferase family 4 protein n=1 Tax=Aestuariibacter salexigens TaxID=226010 RepID=UPI00040BF9E1|nr:glycosyltransferase family 4 protein [Aestuariibacter salexigens]
MTENDSRILILSHGHPDMDKGGAEVAAYNMFKQLLCRDADVYFMARSGLVPHGGTAFSTHHSEREILFHTTMDDRFIFSNIKTRHLWQEFRDLLTLLKPKVVHLHHYFLFGLEVLEEIRKAFPNVKVVLTLHEYLGICHNKGLMVKTNGRLCYRASPRDCHSCFPEKQPGDFFLREQYIKRMFANVDTFVAPSKFLKERYVEWGISPTLIKVIENGQEHVSLSNHSEKSGEVCRLAFFGQINPYKGIDTLLNALTQLPKSVRKKIDVEIHGANLEKQPGVFQEKVQSLVSKLGKAVKLFGPYDSRELPALLSQVDWVVVPSTWWENSPMVIQEAFSSKVPLIVSDIGGMAEKVEDGKTGLHFRAGNSMDLARVIEKVVKDSSLRGKLSENIKPPMSIEQCVDEHVALYFA